MMRKTVLVLAASFLGLLTTAAHATDSLIAASSIPAPACEPARLGSVIGIDGLADGGWEKTLRGTMRLYCPMSLYGHIDSYSITYFDQDRKSKNASFKISLVEYYTDGSNINKTTYCSFDSNKNSPAMKEFVRYSMICNQDLVPGRLYYFEIEMSTRITQSQPSVKFYGIDFKSP